MIAIPGAAFMRPVAMSVGSDVQFRCNERGHEPPMIAIPRADDCGLLHLAPPRSAAGRESWGRHAAGQHLRLPGVVYGELRTLRDTQQAVEGG
jgi:hypothetical protein